MAGTFLTTPVLSAAASFAVPAPKEDGYAWSWVAVDPATKAWKNSSIAPVDLNAAAFAVQQISEGWLQLKEQAPSGKPPKAR
jgi:hypothetical protein